MAAFADLTKMRTGHVRYYNREKGYGILEGPKENGEIAQFFFHATTCGTPKAHLDPDGGIHISLDLYHFSKEEQKKLVIHLADNDVIYYRSDDVPRRKERPSASVWVEATTAENFLESYELEIANARSFIVMRYYNEVISQEPDPEKRSWVSKTRRKYQSYLAVRMRYAQLMHALSDRRPDRYLNVVHPCGIAESVPLHYFVVAFQYDPVFQGWTNPHVATENDIAHYEQEWVPSSSDFPLKTLIQNTPMTNKMFIEEVLADLPQYVIERKRSHTAKTNKTNS